jgi:hypothetical protein
MRQRHFGLTREGIQPRPAQIVPVFPHMDRLRVASPLGSAARFKHGLALPVHKNVIAAME